MGVNASVVFVQTYSLSICVCLSVCANVSVGVLAHSHCMGGCDCFVLLDTQFDSLVIKLCLLSEFRTWLTLQPSYLLLMPSHTVSYPPQRVDGQANLIDIRV